MSRLPGENFELLSLANLGIKLKILDKDISKYIIARSFKFGQLIEGDD